MIVGRRAERSRLSRMVADARNGRSRALVLRGEAGIGKTALLDYAADIAHGMRVIRVAGIESEAEIPFAALQLMFAADADRFASLPEPQARTLGSAFGWSTDQGDRITVGAATLTLMAELAGDRPLLCLLDDVQWFDRSSSDALLFALRRLHSDPVATVLAVRDGDRPFSAPGIEPSRCRVSIGPNPVGCSPPSGRCRRTSPTAYLPSPAATPLPSSSSRRRPPATARCRQRSRRSPPRDAWGSTTAGRSGRFPSARSSPCSSQQPITGWSRDPSWPREAAWAWRPATSNRPSAPGWCA